MPSLDDILQMAQAAQAQMAEAQKGLDDIHVEGMAGGGLVRIKATARGAIQSIDLDDSLIVLEEKSMLEDLIVAALNDARAKADQQSNQHMSKFTEGMGLPHGMELPKL
jgi:DNA-binding YbaB/EbfC family protein